MGLVPGDRDRPARRRAGLLSFYMLSQSARRGRNRLPDREVVAQIAAEDAAKRGASGTEQERHERPERYIGRGLARRIGRLRGVLLSLVDHIVDAVLRVLLA